MVAIARISVGISFWSTSRPTNSSSTVPPGPSSSARSALVSAGSWLSKRSKSAIQPRLPIRSGPTPRWISLARSRSLTTRTLSADRTSQRPIRLSSGLIRRSRSQYGLSIMSPAIWTESGRPNLARSKAPTNPHSIGSSVETRSKPSRRWSAPPTRYASWVKAPRLRDALGWTRKLSAWRTGRRSPPSVRITMRYWSRMLAYLRWRWCASPNATLAGWVSDVSVPTASRRRSLRGSGRGDQSSRRGDPRSLLARPEAPYTGGGCETEDCTRCLCPAETSLAAGAGNCATARRRGGQAGAANPTHRRRPREREMTLDLLKVGPQAAEMAHHAAVRFRQYGAGLPEAQALLRRHAGRWEELAALAGSGRRLPRPLEPLDTRVRVGAAPSDHVVIATDGSQIEPDRHGVADFFLL